METDILNSLGYLSFFVAKHMRKRSGGPFLSYSLDLSDADFLIEEYIIFTIGSFFKFLCLWLLSMYSISHVEQG